MPVVLFKTVKAQAPEIASLPLDQILSTRKVIEIVGHHRSTLHRWMKAGLFPGKHALHGRTFGWRRSDIERWLAGGVHGDRSTPTSNKGSIES
jgi:predicted DNA-binding transcriptional regulator AlpA